MTPDQVGIVIADRFFGGGYEYSGRDGLALHISSAIQQAIAAERERCAKIAEEHAADSWPDPTDGDTIAADIRKGE